MQFMIFLQARVGEVDGLRQWMLQEYAPALAEQQGTQSVVLNLARAVPDGFTIYGGAEVAAGVPYDVVLQVDIESKSVLEEFRAGRAERMHALVAHEHVYATEGTVVLHKSDELHGYPVPGYKLIRGVFFHEDLSDASVERSWERHQHLAVKVHVGMSRYVRHWVLESFSPNAPRIRGITELHFPSEEALLNHYFDSSRGQEEILHDIGHFIAGGTHRMFGQSYIMT